MNKENLKKLIKQIRKYDLVDTFKDPEEFDGWLSNLNQRQIDNFNNLTIDKSLITFPKKILINENLLDCLDYSNRVEAMLKLNNKDCTYPFDKLCSKNFLNSKNYYEDLELMSKASTIQYVLWVIDHDAFINSPYHTEDLKLIINAKDTTKENGENSFANRIVAEALAETARNPESIKSPYHQADMKLISTCSSEVLQSIHSYPYDAVNTLAIDTVSLKDKYHLENMQILAKNPISSIFLHKIMTDEEIVKGKYYRDEVNALATAKSKLTARAIYNYITNPDRVYDRELGDTYYNFDYHYISLTRGRNIKGNKNPKYLEYLKLLNTIDDEIVLYFEILLSDEELLQSKYYEHDINFALTVNDKDIFEDIYRVILDETSLSSPYHIKDLDLISKTKNKEARNWLTCKATDEYSLESPNHEYDMQYIAKLELDKIENKKRDLMHYYLFNKTGIMHPYHIEILEDILKDRPLKNYNTVSNYLDELEEQLNNPNTFEYPKEIYQISNQPNNNKKRNKVLSKVKNIFKKR